MYVAGEFGQNQNSSFGTIAYDSATGARRWASLSRHDGGMREFTGSVPSYTLALSPDGRTLVGRGIQRHRFRQGRGRHLAWAVKWPSARTAAGCSSSATAAPRRTTLTASPWPTQREPERC